MARAFSESAARGVEVESQQHQLLLVVKALRPPDRPTIRTIAERLQIQHNSAVELVDRAEEHGLVLRKPSADDRRAVVLEITPRGELLLRELKALGLASSAFIHRSALLATARGAIHDRF